MPQLTNKQVGDLARELGHTEVTIAKTASGRRWIVECSCGYGAALADGRPTITRATFDEAVRTGQHHLRTSVRAFLERRSRDGLSATVARQQ